MSAMRLLLIVTLGSVLPAQRPADAAAVDRAERRAIDDLGAVCAALQRGPVAFRGSCRLSAIDSIAWADAEPIRFRGAWDRGLSLLHTGRFTVLAHGDQQVQRTGDDPWTGPQGDAPDMPFAPRVLARHLASATIRSPTPVFLDGRPTMRVHAQWTGDAAAALVRETYHPESKAQQYLERMAELVAGQHAEDTVVDAAVCFDPALRSLRSAVLRVAMVHRQVLPESAEPDPAPDGLPVLTRRVLLQYTFVLEVVPVEDVPIPTLDADLQRRLRWPPAPAAGPAVR